ncbi:pyruvate dehydrogenase [Streptomyces olivochromogenes]|uniref:Pyruvate dehydrogenase n=1 Tax=Streptomyces olivochromogenes TaxID=1963 RepID=A0A250VVJ0_STROL|nr:pyruvate dehydrogenase [Streptomyces olivochromogenes]
MTDESERLVSGWNGRYFEDFVEGDAYRHPLGRTVTQTDNSWMTLLTHNTAPLHFDAHYAAQTSWGRPLAEAFASPRPTLVDVRTDPNALSLPSHITAAQVRGFALASTRTVLDGRVGRMLDLARSNLRNIPRP